MNYKLIAEKQKDLIRNLKFCFVPVTRDQDDVIKDIESELQQLESEPDIYLAEMSDYAKFEAEEKKVFISPSKEQISIFLDGEWKFYYSRIEKQSEPIERKTADVGFSHSFKFGDIVVNHFASKDNPHRQGVFIRYRRNNRSKTAELTNMKGEFWYCPYDIDSKLQVTGSIFASQSLPEITDERLQKIISAEQNGFEPNPTDTFKQGMYSGFAFGFERCYHWYRNEIKSRL
jgi:hypothetical protein